MNNTHAILFVLPWDIHTPGGVNVVVQNLIRQCHKDPDCSPLLFVPDWHTKSLRFSHDSLSTLIQARLVSPGSKTRQLKTTAHSLFRSIALLIPLYRLIHSHSIVCVNVHFPGPSFYVFAMLKALLGNRLSFVLSVHGADLTRIAASRGFAKRAVTYMASKADWIVACSDALNARTQKTFPNHRQKCLFIHNGIDPDATDAMLAATIPAELALPERYLINVAKFEEKKGQDTLLKAFRLLLHSGYDGKLVLIGATTPYLSALRQLAHELAIADSVIFLQDIEHPLVLRAIRKAELFVLSSVHEPFGLVLLEAGYLGVPIVATNVDGVREVVGENGALLISSNDPSAMADAMQQALSSVEVRSRLTRNMRERTKVMFTWTEAYRQYKTLYSSFNGSAFRQ